jgi:hypothetical protein
MSEQGEMLPIGTVLEGRYRLVSEGSVQDLGRAYKAYDMQRDRLVVVLALAPQYGTGVAAWECLSRAQQAVADLAQPGLVPFEHVGLIGGSPYLVRRVVQGQTLADLMARAGRLEVGKAVEITLGLCEALTPAHRQGLAHGGLSPQSVLVGDEGRVTVLDAGLLPALRPVFGSPGQPWGRVPYLSPEQAAGKDIHPAADVYVIGALLYAMLAGRPPLRAQDPKVLALQHMHQEPPSLHVLVPQVPTSLAQVVHRALAKEPAARYRNAGQLAHILRSQSRPQRGEAPAAAPGSAGEHLIVPAPPAQSRPEAVEPARAMRRAAPQVEEGDEELDRVDWLMIWLIVIAVIAVLGLIPLWRTVHRRYTAPQPMSPISYGSAGTYGPVVEGVGVLGILEWQAGTGEAGGGLATRPTRWAGEGTWTGSELDEPGLVWYNRLRSGLSGLDRPGLPRLGQAL